ncbi:hypothetical protein FB45DRAFT_898268 [Roridomyces roridus]|uniref:Uncharacterized protein n=1 Tax=Roridomyces roridus TaxID=1738132 RepID=A0AAD7CE33_9AGAR|nr:hypothetical protein FB45DRAFT_898268 [Roridomyces roridus]
MDILARFRRPRGRTTSLSGPASLGSASTSDEPAPPPPTPPPPLQPSIERRIHPDLDSLVANWTAPPRESTDPPSTLAPAPALFSTALRPSTRRHSVDGAPPFVTTRANAQLEEVREVTHNDSPPRPPPSTSSPAPVGWSTFGRRDTASRPRLTDFGFGEHSVSPAVSRQHSLSAPSSSNLSTDEFGVAYDARDAPSPASGFTFGSRGRAAGTASIPPPPPMPALDHPAFRSPPSAVGRETRSSSSLPASIRSSSSRRKRKAQEIFSALALSRPASARRQLSLDAEGAPVLELELPEREEEGRDARRKRVAGSSDTEVGEPAHQSESSSSTMGHKKIGGSLTAMSAPPPPPASAGKKSGKRKAADVESSSKATVTVESRAPTTTTTATSHNEKRARGSMDSVPHSPASPGIATATAPPNTIPGLSSPSHASLPISALVSPHAPSIVRSAVGTGSGYYMQDPRKAQRVQPTGWGLTLGLDSNSGKGKGGREGGSPIHAWLFFLGFLLFPMWAVAGFCVPVPRTRRLHGEEKGEVVLDDAQLEFDARSWRRRCRIMAGVSLVTYVPFIVLVAVFVPRGR